MEKMTADFEIRTMKSDIESIKASGGNLELVKSAEQQNGEGEIKSNNPNPLKTIIILIGLIISLVGIGLLTYYLALKLTNHGH